LKESFTLLLEQDAHGSLVRYSGAIRPDYRHFTGIQREVLRAFFDRLADARQSFYSSNGASSSSTRTAKSGMSSYVIRDPDEHFLSLALAAGVLQLPNGAVLRRAEGTYTCALILNDASASSVKVTLALLNEEGTLIHENFKTISASLIRAGTQLYAIHDLGYHWKESDIFNALIKKTDVTSFLSLMFSRFTNLSLCYTASWNQGGMTLQSSWQTKYIRPLVAQPALLFMEIDNYKYLHVRPLAYLRDFPPTFLENEDIITAVKMNEAEKTFTIAEIIFPESSVDMFRTVLSRAIRGNVRSTGENAAFQTHVYEEAGRFIIAPEFAKSFISTHIFELSKQFVFLQTKVLAEYKVSFAKPRLKISVSTGIDFLSGHAKIEFEDQSYSFTEFMNEYKKTSCIMLANGIQSFPDKRTMNKLEKLLTAINADTVEISLFDVPLLLNDDSIEISGAAWEKARPFFENYNTIEKRPGNWGIENSSLRPYQEYGVRWLDYLREHALGACLADEMGLGKTVQVIALLRSCAAKEQGMCLILCPKSVVYNWTAELDKFAPNLPYIVHYGAERDFDSITNTHKFQLVLSTYATLRRDIQEFLKYEFLYVILDESQNIKNLTTQTTKAVLSLKTKHRLAMSGTPIENNLQDLYSLFRFLNPSFFGSEKSFLAKYMRPIQEDENEDALHDLKVRIYPFILRRLKRDVLHDLPEKTEEIAYIELDDAQLSLYHRKRLEYKKLISGIITKGEFTKSSFFIFKALSELRRLASIPEAEGEYAGPSAKRNYLLEQIGSLTETSHKCLVFANFLAGVEMVSQDLAARGIANLTMTGATGNRHSLIHSFQTDPDIKAFIMTLKTGGTGINLTAADYIFIMDPWWNSAAEAQAIDRSHRIGQVNPVFCYRLIARDTIEERIMELQKLKSSLAGALLSDDAGIFKILSEEDIAFLVGGNDD
jgi:superfamily II DNA or RNA helicase